MKGNLFQIGVVAISVAFFGVLLFVTIVALSRPSGMTGMDASKLIRERT